MKHMSPNKDGSYTILDEEQDGFFLTLFSMWIDAFKYKRQKRKENRGQK